MDAASFPKCSGQLSYEGQDQLFHAGVFGILYLIASDGSALW